MGSSLYHGSETMNILAQKSDAKIITMCGTTTRPISNECSEEDGSYDLHVPTATKTVAFQACLGGKLL